MMGDYNKQQTGKAHLKLFIGSFFLVFFWTNTLLAQQIDRSISWKQACEKGQEAFAAKRYETAVHYFELAEQKYMHENGQEGEQFEKITIWLADAREKLINEKKFRDIKLVVRTGNEAKAKGDYRKAIKYYEYAAKEYPKFRPKDQNYTVIINNLATLYRNQALYHKAEPLYKESLKIIEKLSGKESKGYAVTLGSLAELYLSLSFYQKAETRYLKALTIFDKVVGKRHAYYITTLNNLAELYRARGAYQKSIPLHQEAIKTTLATQGKKNFAYATYLNNLAGTYESLGFYDKAESLYLESQDLFKALFGEDHPRYGLFLSNMARIYEIRDKYDKAEQLYIQATNILANKLGKQHPQYALIMNNLASFYSTKGNYQKAEEILQKIVETMQQSVGAEHPNYALAIGNLASLYQKLSLDKEAEKLYKQAVTILKQKVGTKNLQYIASLSNLATFYKAQELYYKAEPLLIKVTKLMKQSVGLQHPDYALTLRNLGEFYAAQGADQKAEELFLRSLDIIAKRLGRLHTRYSSFLHFIGNFYNDQGQFKKAEKMFVESLKIKKINLGKQNIDYASSLNSLGQVYYRTKRYTQAEELYLEAQKIVLKIKGKNNADYVAVINNLANLYEDQQRMGKAKTLYQESVQIIRKTVGEGHPSFPVYINNLAGFYTRQGEHTQAAPFYLQAIKRKLKVLQKNYQLLSEKERRNYFWKNERYFLNFKMFVIDYFLQNKGDIKAKPITKELVNALFELQLNTKAQLLNSKRRLRALITAKASKDEALASTFKSYQLLKAKTAKSVNLTIEEQERRGIGLKQDLEKINTLEKKLYASVGEENESTQTNNLNFQFLRKQLKKGEAVVSLVRQIYPGNKVFYLVLITTSETKDAPDLLILENGKALETKYLTAYRNSMIFLRKEKYAYKQFWQTIDTYLQKHAISKVYFSPGGAYHSINLRTIRNPATKKYLSQYYDIQLVSSVRDFIQAKASKQVVTNNNTVYLYGRPSYDLSLKEVKALEKQLKGSQLGLISENYAPTEPTSDKLFSQINVKRKKGQVKKEQVKWRDLPGTEGEIKAIGQVLQQNNLGKKLKLISKLGKEVLELAIKNIKQPKVLHIATHGFFVPNQDEEIEKALAKTEKKKLDFRGGGSVSNKTLIDEPMLRSGIALAGVASYERAKPKPEDIEDGVLTAYEVAQMDLRGTELVVLSACETGLGEVQFGEGVYGLQRAFMVAGANTLILSLWEVDDKATKMLMSKFYEYWIKQGPNKQQMNKQEAFAAAQQYVRSFVDDNGKKIYSHPQYWGGFQLISTGR